jgi:hypothetical protein
MQNYSETSNFITLKETSLDQQEQSLHRKKRTNSFDEKLKFTELEKNIVFTTEEDPVFIADQSGSNLD